MQNTDACDIICQGEKNFMNIGIDFDGVIFDSEKMFRAYSRIFNLKIDGDDMLDCAELKAQKRYGWNNSQFEQFLDDCLLDILRDAPLMPCAKTVLNALSKKHKIYAISSRGGLDKREIDVTEARLKQEGLRFEKVVYSSIDKLQACKELNIDIMIDDLFGTIENLANNNIKCFYLRDYIHHSCKHQNVIEVHDWGDIAYELVKQDLIDKNDLIEHVCIV